MYIAISDRFFGPMFQTIRKRNVCCTRRVFYTNVLKNDYAQTIVFLFTTYARVRFYFYYFHIFAVAIVSFLTIMHYIFPEA